MAIYKVQKTGIGATVYRMDNKLIKTADVPSNVVDLLEHQPEVDDTNLKLQTPYRNCVFCKDYTKLSRMVNQQTVYICEKDFYDKTIGQIAQQVRLNEKPDYEALGRLLNGDSGNEES